MENVFTFWPHKEFTKYVRCCAGEGETNVSQRTVCLSEKKIDSIIQFLLIFISEAIRLLKIKKSPK